MGGISKRRCSSTLASEALALDQALGELEWLQIMFRDVVYNDVNRSNWQQSILPFQAVLRDDCELRSRLEQCTITDAKSLFDAITKDNPASRQDRRTATEIAIILESIRKSHSVTRWTPHPKMIADVLTKDDISKSNGALEEVVRPLDFDCGMRTPNWPRENQILLPRIDPRRPLPSYVFVISVLNF